MILDSLENHRVYWNLGAHFKTAFSFLEEQNISSLEAGRHTVEEDSVYVLVQEYKTKPKDQAVWEAHRRYLDVQYIVSGQEMMGHGHISAFTIKKEDPGRDFIELIGQGNYFNVQAGQFTVFWPHDVHAPGLIASVSKEVKKLVVKIRL